METGYAKLTVCFEAPFWICLYERSGGCVYIRLETKKEGT